jgi:hypothetical protein
MNLSDISVVVTTHNDARCIRACLESARGFGETVVVDAFSVDGVTEIEFPVTVYRRHSDSDAEQKNWAVSRAARKWVLALEPYDVVTDSLKQEISQIDGKGTHGFVVKSETEYLGKKLRGNAAAQPGSIRLFERGRVEFVQAGSRAKAELDGSAAALSAAIRGARFRDVHAHFDAINRETTMDARATVDGGGGRLSLVRMLLHPPLGFLNRYFLRLGFVDGSRGLIYCLVSSYAAFIEYAKTWEYRRDLRRQRTAKK